VEPGQRQTRQVLVDARIAKGFKTAASLARQLGVPRNSVCRWERGYNTPRMPMAVKVARLLERPVEELFG